MKAKYVDLDDVHSPARLLDLLRAREPFVARGKPAHTAAFTAAVSAFGRRKMDLWNQENDFFHTFRRRYARWNDDSCPCTEMSFKDTIQSTALDVEADFQVVLPYIFPGSEIDRVLVKPTLAAHLRPFMKQVRHTNLFNTLFVSRGAARGIAHAHNYDVLGFFLQASPGSRIHLFPIEYFDRFKSECMPARAGVVNLHIDELEDPYLDEAITHELASGDIVHIPFGWYHRLDHDGTYVHLATNWYLPALAEERIAALRPAMPEAAWRLIAAETRKLPQWNVRAPLEHVTNMIAAPVRELWSRLGSA